MRTLSVLLTFIAGLSISALAVAQELGPKLGGDAVTVENNEDVTEMIRIADAIDSSVDAKDWRGLRGFFTRDVNADFNSIDGSRPATIPVQELVNRWATNLSNDKTSFHMRSNHRVTFNGPDEAVMLSHAYAWNRLEDGAAPQNGANAFWEVWANYTHAFIRTPQGWKVNGMKVDMTAERGNPFVRNTPGS